MTEKDILDINSLNDDDLLELYNAVTNHLKYLQDNIITFDMEEGGEISDES